jgi:hypothetical protein
MKFKTIKEIISIETYRKLYLYIKRKYGLQIHPCTKISYGLFIVVETAG